ncbi:hypothetical protein AB0I69_42950 [Streptomyces sp. NPDC050508]|uniref:hypothetical protein n=1 Tax=Streptomyces sp. NPDC050508 TaxID=3155405 RepID=UPI00341218D7
MANFLDDQSDVQRFAALLDDYERRLQALERTTQAGYTSIEGGGSLDIYDEEGTLKGSVGVQPDGGVALVPVNTAPPPTPTAPAVETVLAGLLVGWDGTWADAYTTPSDFSHIQIHVGATEDFTPDLTTQLATITAPLGGTATIAIEGYEPVWVRLVGANTAALTGPASEAVQGTPRQAVPQDLVDGIITENKLAEDAVTAAKIALGAVGTTALADGAVLEDKLAKAAVTLGKIAAGAVTINALGGALSDSATQRYVDAMGDPTAWQTITKGSGAAWNHLTGITDAPTGQTVAQAQGFVQQRGLTLIPYEPGTVYRVSARVRLTAPASGSDTFYVGVLGVGADTTTLVNRSGANSASSHYYVAASNQTITAANGWVTVIGYLKDRAATGATGSAGPNTDPRAAGLVHADVRFISPYLWLNYTAVGGGTSTSVMQVDAFTIESLKTGLVDSTNFVAGSVTTAALATDSVTAGKVAADAISARELQANSVTAAELTAGSVTAVAVAAGAITTDKLTVVGGANLLSDPSFEGAYSASLVAGNAYFAIDTKGTGSAKSLKVNAVATAATTRSLKITSVPVLAGDQLFLAFDYLASSDYTAAAFPKFYAKWEDSAGATLGWGVAQPATLTADGTTWTRVTATVTAPATAVQASIWVESFQASAGSLWVDNAAVRPVLAGVMIADGAVTAPKILAGAVTTEKLTALGVTAEKIASLAVTTAKLDALAVTADKLAVNSVTATKIAAGAVEATHIKAGAITADKLDADAINGKTITGATVQTAASGPRIVLNSANLTGYGTSGNKIGIEPNDKYPYIYWTSTDGTNRAVINVSGGTSDANLGINSGTFVDSADGVTYKWRTYLGNDFWVAERVNTATLSANGGRLYLGKSTAQLGAGPGGTVTLSGEAGIRAAGVFRADNISMGVVTITPTANTPTSVTLSGGSIKGTNFRAFVTAQTAAPGTQVLGVSVSGVSSAGMTIWLTRTNANSTSIHWMIIGED